MRSDGFKYTEMDAYIKGRADERSESAQRIANTMQSLKAEYRSTQFTRKPPAFDEWLVERIAELTALVASCEAQIAALEEKYEDCPHPKPEHHWPCGCSFDNVKDICVLHAPEVKRLTALVAELQARKLSCVFCAEQFSFVGALREHSYNCPRHPAVIEAAELKEEVEELQGKMARDEESKKNPPIRCSYCGVEICKESEFAYKVPEHMAACEKHPLVGVLLDAQWTRITPENPVRVGDLLIDPLGQVFSVEPGHLSITDWIAFSFTHRCKKNPPKEAEDA